MKIHKNVCTVVWMPRDSGPQRYCQFCLANARRHTADCQEAWQLPPSPTRPVSALFPRIRHAGQRYRGFARARLRRIL